MKTIGSRCLLVLGLLSCLAPSPSLAAEIRLESTQPRVGEQVEVTVSTDRRVVLEAIYRPGSQVAQVEQVGAFEASETIAWQPRRAGLVRLQVVGSNQGEPLDQIDLAVRFERSPVAAWGVLGLVVAAFGGGLITALRRHR